MEAVVSQKVVHKDFGVQEESVRIYGALLDTAEVHLLDMERLQAAEMLVSHSSAYLVPSMRQSFDPATPAEQL